MIKAGDKVRLKLGITDNCGVIIPEGFIGTVVDVDGGLSCSEILVGIKNFHGHSGNDYLTLGYDEQLLKKYTGSCWWIPERYIEKL